MLSRRPDPLWRFVLVALATASVFAGHPQFGARPIRVGESETAPVNTTDSQVSFEADVLPIFKSNCIRCHGSEVKMKDLDLGSYRAIIKGSESGPVIVPGRVEESRLYKMVKDGVMPAGGSRLAEAQIGMIRSWIEGGAPSSQSDARALAAKVSYQDVLPILLLRCTVCHGLRRQEGGLDLHTLAGLLKGGNSGPVVVPGKPDESLMLTRIRSGEMPPKKRMLEMGVKPITASETEHLAQWIAQSLPEGKELPDVAGAGPDPLVSEKDRQFWAFLPPREVTVPVVRDSQKVRNPIDAFILSKLEERGLTFSPEADRAVLLRRAYFDLTGLPPEPKEVQRFLADLDSQAYEKVIDRLLDSPRYGERWGRHWLDVAGYADSEGGKLSADHLRAVAFRYRDYVIRAFNDDKPYDRFLLEQIAGDELEDYQKAPIITQQLMDNLIATGFLRMGPDSTSEREVNFVDDRLDVIGDEMDILGSGVLGLTVKCAKCHSHKYDPIPQRDYYRLLDIFKGAYDEHDWLMPQHAGNGNKVMAARFLPYVTPGATPAQVMEEQQERETYNGKLDRDIEALKSELDQKAEPLKTQLLDQKLNQFPPSLREDLRAMLAMPPESRDEVQKYLAKRFEGELKISPRELKNADPVYRQEAERTERQIKLIEYRKLPEFKIRALWDRGVPSPTRILRRGEPDKFGDLVGPEVPAALTDGKAPMEVTPPWPGATKTGRRLAFARWLVRPENPLTSRVMVNRIWKHHFGNGIVKTLGNFGNAGARPTHPDLLDWMATEFVRQGWSIKSMHRMMMTSSTYRQSSAVTPSIEKDDPENILLSRMPLKRMEAEVLNDTLLLISGRLDETRYGVPQPVEVRDDGLVTPIETPKGWRRSIYVTQRRSELPTLLENFDMPAMSPNCLERNVSIVAPQALNLLNNAMIQKLVRSLAERVRQEAGDDPRRQVERLHWIVYGRLITEEEKKLCLEALNRLAQSASPPSHSDRQVATSAASRALNMTDPAKRGSDEGRDFAALTKLCQTLVNSAAFLYID